MFVVLLNYLRPLEVIDELLPAHVAFLEGQYRAGFFLASGRRVPRTGGVILARAASREELDAVLAQDPFAAAGAAAYEVVEFCPTKSTPELACILEG